MGYYSLFGRLFTSPYGPECGFHQGKDKDESDDYCRDCSTQDRKHGSYHLPLKNN